MNNRPKFEQMKSYQEFSQYYWYLAELKQVAKSLGIDDSGTKLELNYRIEEYFKGNLIKKKTPFKKIKITGTDLTLDTKLIECGFVFNQRFREFFANQTGIKNFKFNTDMVATAKKAKETKDSSFTLGDMVDIYYGKKEYAKNDSSACQWNQFLKDFCKEEENSVYRNKWQVASYLWNQVRISTRPKIYTNDLKKEYEQELKKVAKMK